MRNRNSRTAPRRATPSLQHLFALDPAPTLKQCLSMFPEIPAGGARRDRTDDLLLAKQALSQLSYGPAGARPIAVMSRAGKWWAWDDSNVRPHPYQGCALTT